MEDTIIYCMVGGIICSILLIQLLCCVVSAIVIFYFLCSIHSFNLYQIICFSIKGLVKCLSKKPSTNYISSDTTVEMEQRSTELSDLKRGCSVVQKERRLSIRIPHKQIIPEKLKLVSFGCQPILDKYHMLSEEQKMKHFLKRAGLTNYIRQFLENKALYMDIGWLSEDDIMLSKLIPNSKDRNTFRKCVTKEYQIDSTSEEISENDESDLEKIKLSIQDPIILIENFDSSLMINEHYYSSSYEEDEEEEFETPKLHINTKPNTNQITETRIATPKSIREIDDIKISPDRVTITDKQLYINDNNNERVVILLGYYRNKMCPNHQKGTPVAIKRQYIKPDKIKTIIKEVRKLKHLNHQNIIEYHGCYFSEEIIIRKINGKESTIPPTKQLTSSIITEYCKTGDMYNFIHKHSKEYKKIKNETRLRFLSEIASAICHLHKMKFVHRDIKLNNILLDNNLSVKICDFGASKTLESICSEGPFTFVGTPGYMAPEICGGSPSKNKTAIDVFSFGIVMWEIWTGKQPFRKESMQLKNQYELLFHIKNNNLRPPIKDVQHAPIGFIDLMVNCWQTNPSDRPCSFFAIREMINKIQDDYVELDECDVYQ